MAEAKVPKTVDSPAKADAGAPKVPQASGVPSLTDGVVTAKAEVADIPVEAAALVPEVHAPRPAAPVPVKAQISVKPKRAVKPKVAKAKIPIAKPVPPKAAPKTTEVAKPLRKQATPKAKSISNTNKASSIPQLKEKIMATKTPDFAKGIQDAIADVQGKAKAAFEKGTASLGEVSEFTKGNVEALVESGKIFASGAQSLGSTYVADSRAAFETLTADVKELASAKNPADFFKLQGDLARRNFDTAIAAGSKNSEALFKLVNEAFAPISGRVSLAVDKIKQAA